jgi:nucleoporin SEH1
VEIEWKAHDAPITRVSWAHPEHGSLVASSSFDRTVKIWQENNRNTSAVQSSKWVERAVLTEAKGSVRSIEFSPSYFGLKLVSCVYMGCLLQTSVYHPSSGI